MKTDAIWQAFSETGDPVCYLLYKTVEANKDKGGKKNTKEASGNSPRAEG